MLFFAAPVVEDDSCFLLMTLGALLVGDPFSEEGHRGKLEVAALADPEMKYSFGKGSLKGEFALEVGEAGTGLPIQ